jgi:hypothetical protein
MDTISKQREAIINIPVPESTRTYTAIPNGLVVASIEQEIEKAGLKIYSEHYKTNGKGNQVIGTFSIASDDADMGMMIAFQNSYDKSKRLAVAVGGHVFICTNGAVVGDAITLNKKHQGSIFFEMQESIHKGVDVMFERYEKLRGDKERMLNVTMDKRTISELVGRMYIEEALITAEQLSVLKKELDEPTHEYDNIENNSLWAFYNNVTYSYKEKANPRNWMQNHIDLHSFVEGEFFKPKGNLFVPLSLEESISEPFQPILDEIHS